MPSRAKSVLALLLPAALLAGCATREHTVVTSGITTMPAAGINLGEAASQNRNRFVADAFADTITVLTDTTGLAAARLFFADSDSLIIAEATDAAQLRAASLAVMQHAPMVVYDHSQRGELFALADALGVSRVLLVGNVPIAETSGQMRVIQDPGTNRAMGDLTAFQPTSQVVGSEDHMVQAVADLDPSAHTELKAAWEATAQVPSHGVGALPAQSPRDGQMAPVIIATPATPVAAVANARSYGGGVRVMPSGDPTDTKAGYAMVAGLEDGPLVALGPEFGDSDLLADRIRQGWHE